MLKHETDAYDHRGCAAMNAAGFSHKSAPLAPTLPAWEAEMYEDHRTKLSDVHTMDAEERLHFALGQLGLLETMIANCGNGGELSLSGLDLVSLADWVGTIRERLQPLLDLPASMLSMVPPIVVPDAERVN